MIFKPVTIAPIYVEVKPEHLYNFVRAVASLTGGSPIIRLAPTKRAFNVRFPLDGEKLLDYALLEQAYEVKRMPYPVYQGA
jgi:hypothetical protein